MSHVMGSAIDDLSPLQGLLPCFFDINAAKGCFTRKDERFLRIALLIKFLHFLNDGIAQGDAAGPSVFALFDEGDLIGEIDMSPFEIEDFALAGTGGE